MTTIRTVADLKAFLEQFSDDTLVEFSHGRYFNPVSPNFPGVDSEEVRFGFYSSEFEYEPARAAYSFVPSQDSLVRAAQLGYMPPVAQDYPAQPAVIRFGAENDD